jgi:two-component system, chemotaxis family, sensor kinase CheA
MQESPARTVLIVEPDAESRTALRSALERDGYSVVSTAGAADALTHVESPGISVVVTELYLESGDDRCLLHSLRQSAYRSDARVLAYTRHTKAADRAWAIAEGADGYVLKKNGEAHLLDVVRRLSSRTRTKRSATRSPAKRRRRKDV